MRPLYWPVACFADRRRGPGPLARSAAGGDGLHHSQPDSDVWKSIVPAQPPIANGHLIITFDQKRPSATFVWSDTGAAIKVTYLETVDRVMHLASPHQGRIMLPLGEIVEPVPGVRMKFYEPSRPKVWIEAPKNVRIVR
jgi:hypothetical protein